MDVFFMLSSCCRQNMNDLIRLLVDANINILTVEAVSDTDNPDQHILSLLVSHIELKIYYVCKLISILTMNYK